MHLVGFTIGKNPLYENEMFHLVPASRQLAEPVWHMPDAVCTVLDSWWWTERPSETCRMLIRNKINLKYCASSWFYYRKNPLYENEMFHLVPASRQLAEPVEHVPDAVCTVLDSWWWAERPSETCRTLIQNKINLRHFASGWFYCRKNPLYMSD